MAPDADKTWAYPLNYDPLRDQGKRNRNAKGFEILEKYDISDISIIRNNEKLMQLLANLDHIRGLGLKINEYAWIFPKRGKTITPSSFLESIAFSTYNAIPEEIRYEKISGKRLPGSPDWRETPEGERIRQELFQSTLGKFNGVRLAVFMSAWIIVRSGGYRFLSARHLRSFIFSPTT